MLTVFKQLREAVGARVEARHGPAKTGEQRHMVLREYMPAGLATRRSDSFTVRALRASDRPDFDWGLARLRQEAEALAAFTRGANGFSCTFDCVSGRTYLLEYKERLSDANWQQAGTVTATGASAAYPDRSAP